MVVISPLDHWTIDDDRERYQEYLTALRERRLSYEHKVRTARQATESVKFGSVRATLEKRLVKLDKLLSDIDSRIDKANALYEETFG